MTHSLKVRWAIAAAIAKATHIRIDDQKELYIANNSSDGKSVTVQDPNDQYKTIKVELEGRGIDNLKFWTKVPVYIPDNEPLVAYYELLCFNLGVGFSDKQGIVELKESVFQVWEDDIELRGMPKNGAKMQMAYHGLPDSTYSASHQMRDILDDPNFLKHNQAYTLTICVFTVARALRELLRNKGFNLSNLHPEMPLILDAPVDWTACRIHNQWCGISGAEEKVVERGQLFESKMEKVVEGVGGRTL